MWQLNNRRWWLLVVVAVFIVLAWPPDGDKSLAVRLVNWAVDPWDELPVLPPPSRVGAGDDPEAVYLQEVVAHEYYTLRMNGGWTRLRLDLKVAEDPFDEGTARQLLTVVGVVAALLAWRLAGRKK